MIARIMIFFTVVLLFSSCKKDESGGTVTDIDGNVYKTAVIGKQVWMTENLRVTKFNDGSDIKLVESNAEWQNTTMPAFSWYDNDSVLFGKQYGALYNGYVAQNDDICPTGWHLPDVNDYMKLIETLGDTLTAGGKLKSIGVSLWRAPNEKADNGSHFTALPAGMRYFEGTFSAATYFTAYWTSTEINADSATYVSLSYLNSKVIFGDNTKNTGFSIRCVKNVQ